MNNFQYQYTPSSTIQNYHYPSNSFQPQSNFINPTSTSYTNPNPSYPSNYQTNYQFSQNTPIQTHPFNHINYQNNIKNIYEQSNPNQNKYISTSIHRQSESFSQNNIIPIDQIQFRSRIANKNQEIIVYQSDDSPFKNHQKDYTLRNQTGLLKLNPNSILDMQKRSRKRRQREQAYNLYSCLDQPFERVKQLGCSGLTCPNNQFIASQTPEKDWFN